jgi:hypothetical protein
VSGAGSAAGAAADTVEPKPETLDFLAWSALWSPLTAEDLREAAWQALELPGCFADLATDYWSTFHAGVPQPPVPALIHALLGIDGAGVREDWLRAAHYLGLGWQHALLPPDQLGPACEIFAIAIEREEPVIVATLGERYLQPWIDRADRQLDATAHPALAGLLACFREHTARALGATRAAVT